MSNHHLNESIDEENYRGRAMENKEETKHTLYIVLLDRYRTCGYTGHLFNFPMDM